MSFDLCTIDWTAIGAIVTFVAMIIAYWTIHISDKQNKSNQRLQLLLVQREIEQKRLDELIENIIIINDSIQPIIVTDYSVKLTNGIFTEDDRHFIDEMAVKDELDSNRLSVQLIRYCKNEPVKNVLMILSNMRQKYGEWVRCISTLNLYQKNYVISPSNLNRMILTMSNMSKAIMPNYEKDIHDILETHSNDLDKAISLMNIFSHAISKYLILNKRLFEKELCVFVSEEQKRIDSIVFHGSVK